MNIKSEKVVAGQAIYSRRVLQAYDFVVLGISNHLIWKCPTAALLEHYNANVTNNHLDVGVGSGFFPDRCTYPSATPRVGLMDLNVDALMFAAARVARYTPELHHRNVLERIETQIDRFDSVAINYLLHCLPGSLHDKCIIFDHLRQLLNPGGRLFGATLLYHGVPLTWLASRLMRFYNRRGIFCNTSDSLDNLRQELELRFTDVLIRTVGCAAIFSARVDLTQPPTNPVNDGCLQL